MKHILQKSLIILGLAVVLSSCSVSNRAMKTPNYHVEYYKSDFDYSEQVVAEASAVRIFGVDWNRLFGWKSGSLESDRFSSGPQTVVLNGSVAASPVLGNISAVIPVLGEYGKGKVSSYALYNLMEGNPGYDVVIYPQYESKKFWIPIFYSKTTVEVKARLGKIN